MSACSRSRWWVRVAVTVLALVVGWAPASSAFGHGADGLALQGRRGAYLVSVFDARPSGSPGEAEFRLVLSRAAPAASPGITEAAGPIVGARVEITDARGRVHRAEGIGSVYYFTLADRAQRLRIAVKGPLGDTAFAVDVHGLPASGAGGSSRLPSILVVSVVVACVRAWSWYVLRRRSASALADGTGS